MGEEKEEEGMLVGVVDVLKKLAAAAAPGAERSRC
jgi:hypothetical protein